MSKNKYFIGLDIGTSSVGWAVADTDLNLIKAKNKNFWGVRKFDSGKTAEERRTYRSTRRRLNRRKQRLALLQDFFEEEINEIDGEFFNKLENSWVSKKDEERTKGADFVFNQNQTKDKELYYSKFPTIWHLRKYLIENSNNKIDIRWVYLAIHHILKYRGNFLYTDAEFQQTDSAIENQLERFIDYLEKTYDVEIIREEFIKDVKEVLQDQTKTSAAKKDELISRFKNYKIIKSQLTQFINAILGYKANLKTLFSYDKQSISVYIQDGVEDDEKFSELREHLGLDEDVLDVLVEIYSWGVLRKLLPDETNQYISKEMVKQYEEYGQDLIDLKELFDEYSTKENKREFFKSKKIKKNYYHYDLSKKDVPLEDLYKTLDKLLPINEKIKTDRRYQRYLKRREDLTFLKVQNTTDKGAIPHQLHEIELEKILENQGKYYPFLKEERKKIGSILKFRIPYYVGPLNQASEFAWFSRMNGKKEKIYPWNFDEVVDKEHSEEEFIKRMVGHCTYLTEEPALPLESLTYQEYNVLNELNRVLVNNRRLDTITKQAAINDLFKKYNVITVTRFKNWLEKYIGENQGYQITGLSDPTKFNSSMSSWKKFIELGIDLEDKELYQMAEEVILWGTIFSEKASLRKRIERLHGDKLTENKIKTMIQWNFKGWGRLSNELLDGIIFELPSGERTTIIERMRKTDDHFMQIINNKDEGFANQLQDVMLKENKKNDVLDQIKELPGSPAIKKGIHQAVLLVEEIKKIMGNEPEKIFLEFAREDREKVRTKSRYKQLEEIYKTLAKENSELFNKEAHQHLKELSKEPEKLNNEKLYLYFLQNGRCLYSGREIDWQNLGKRDYEVDHILPQSYTKDDSFSNKALVDRKYNQRKSDDLLLKESIIHKQRNYWTFLKNKQLISEKKFYNLTRTKITTLTKKGFINRQLVETRQISKHVKNLLINLYPETKVQTIKAQFVSDYRRKEKLYKVRGLNDFHHAHDAFLALYLGEFIDRRLPWINNYDPRQRKEYDKQIDNLYADRKTFNKENKYGLLNLIYKDSEKNQWQAKEQNVKVAKYLNYKDCFVTYKPEKRSGEFYNQNLDKASHGKLTGRKLAIDPTIYGGYKEQKTAYFALVEVKKKIKAVPIPVQISKEIENKNITTKTYINEIEPSGKIIREQVLINTLFELNGHPFIARSHNERINGKQLTVPKSLQKLLYSAEKEFNYEEKVMDFENYINVLLSKLKSQFILLGKSDDFIKNIKNNYEELIKLTIEEIDDFIIESLHFFQVNTINPRFKIESIADFRNKTRYGRMGSIPWNQGIVLIDQSITGYYESRTEL